MPVINVKIKDHPYPVIIETGAIRKLNQHLKKHVYNKRLFVFYDANFYALHHKSISKNISRNYEIIEMVLPSGERTKSLSQYRKVVDFLLSEKIDRSDFILACGGGVISDLIGFVAANLLRGIKWGIVSTTLMGMVDAAIGGKTGINHRLGKNLLGSFHQPAFVLCDLDFLGTLPTRHMVSGAGELLKYAGLMGSGMFQAVKKYLECGDLYNMNRLLELIPKAVRYKARIVVDDPCDQGRRKILNFGHTFAHGIEKAAEYKKLYHGEAVILGILVALKADHARTGKRSKALWEYEDLVQRTLRLLPHRTIKLNRVLDAMQYDKKKAKARLNFVLLRDLGNPVIIDSLNNHIVSKSLEQTMDWYHKHGGSHAANPGR